MNSSHDKHNKNTIMSDIHTIVSLINNDDSIGLSILLQQIKDCCKKARRNYVTYRYCLLAGLITLFSAFSITLSTLLMFFVVPYLIDEKSLLLNNPKIYGCVVALSVFFIITILFSALYKRQHSLEKKEISELQECKLWEKVLHVCYYEASEKNASNLIEDLIDEEDCRYHTNVDNYVKENNKNAISNIVCLTITFSGFSLCLTASVINMLSSGQENKIIAGVATVLSMILFVLLVFSVRSFIGHNKEYTINKITDYEFIKSKLSKKDTAIYKNEPKTALYKPEVCESLSNIYQER